MFNGSRFCLASTCGHSRAKAIKKLGPAFLSPLAERARVAFRTHRLAIGVVIKLDEVRSPPDEHGMLGRQKNAECGAEALQPAARGAERAGAPVIDAHQGAHFPPPPSKKSRLVIAARRPGPSTAESYSLPFQVASRMIWRSVFGLSRCRRCGAAGPPGQPPECAEPIHEALSNRGHSGRRHWQGGHSRRPRGPGG